MIKNLLLILGIILFAGMYTFAQEAVLQGKIIDKKTKEPISFANIVVENRGSQVGGTSSDFDGKYVIKPLPPGKFDVKATFVGYKTILIKGVTIPADRIRFLNIELEPTAETLKTVEIIDYKVPLIDKDNTVSGASVTAEQIAKMPQRNANAVATTVGGVFSLDGERGSIRGARSDATAYFIDGVRVIGTSAVPQSAIEQVDVILGGVPARYGDATSGVINVTTKGPARRFNAGIELETSQFLDAYGYKRGGFNVMGPIIRSKDRSKPSLFGFFLAGDFIWRQDGRPSAIGYYTTTEDALKYIEQNPLRPSGVGEGTFLNAEYLRSDDLRHVKTSMNTARNSINLVGKLDIRTSQTMNLTFGGSYYYYKGNNFSYNATLANYNKNSRSTNTNYRIYAKFSQRFPGSENKSVFKNFFYSIQADYSKNKGQNGDPNHMDNLFNYGYLGKYTTYKTPTFELGSDTVNGHYYNDVWVLNSWDFDTLIDWSPRDINPLVAQYTNSYYDIYAGQPDGHYRNMDEISLGGGLLNGDNPLSIYSLYQSPGTNQSGYSKYDNNQYSIRLDASLDIKDHAIKLGFQYEQRVSSFIVYGPSNNYLPTGLWTLMRGLTNFHIRQLDKDNPVAVAYDGQVDTILYYRKYDQASQRYFDVSLRKALGLPVDGLDFILTDSYDPDNNTMEYYDKFGTMHTADLNQGLQINMFSPDELWNDGFSYINYSGFNYTGEKLKTQPAFTDFFNEKDENGMATRPIGAFRPIYMAGYLQDQFAFKDLIFNIGVRVDRYDANQSVLADPFVLYPAYTVGEVSDLGGKPVSVPSNIGNDYVVYVNRVDDPSFITGYRDGFIWYNADGIEVFDPSVLDVGNGISPLLKDPSQDRVSAGSFKDYEPQINIMPRISFSFPISDEALFFAHYDVLTQRPTSNSYTSPATWYYFDNISTRINNPSLKPTKTIDYEVGFTQKISNASSVTFTTFYKEMRNMIQVYRFNGAYPKDYTSYNNIDFGTVKGLTAGYDLRRTKNVSLRAYYTLQFADATGASPTTAASLINAGLPNLRSTFPLPWDRRHQFNLSLDYAWSSGKKYNGPRTNRKNGKKPIDWLSNTGFSVTMTGGSGVPYSASRNVVSPLSGGGYLLSGTISGNRLPWQFKLDARVYKDIYFRMGKAKEGEDVNQGYINVYFQFINLLNTRNVINVYPYTGNPNDDGYLSAPEWQRQINNQLDPQSFREMYSLYVNRPMNYSTPIQIRFGLIFNF